MTLQDLLLTPVYLIFIYVFAYSRQNRIQDKSIRGYYLPALHVKIIGAIGLGLVYQFYYRGGDTFNFFNDSLHIWEAFKESPLIAFSIIFGPAQHYDPFTYEYTRKIYYFIDPGTFNVIRVAGFLNLFTFATYTVDAVFFALVSFTGVWAMYLTFIDNFPEQKRQLAFATFFVPSVFFWGSGLMKDSLCLGALGWLFFSFHQIFFKRKNWLTNGLILITSGSVLIAIKIYILICFAPALSVWLFLQYRANIRSRFIRTISLPIFAIASLPLGLYAINKIAEENPRYNLDNVAATAKESSEWLKYVAEREGGSRYDLGEFDGTLGSMLVKFPQAVWLSLYRPYIFEARNPLMFLSALESSLLLLLTLRIVFSGNLFKVPQIWIEHPLLLMGFVFSVFFAFSIAMAAGNFGSLVRYKIPFIPFFMTVLYVTRYKINKSTRLF
ncbi:MAG TPA: hypothetical protein DCM08_00195 [Microscillaceae bacterium]|jgi:hypothetical protein|nr:hypothetical protein [Microscillaceae bacterium]